MPRCLIFALGALLAVATPSHAVNLTGAWSICADCRVGGVCDPLSISPTNVDDWTITQTGASLAIASMAFGAFTGSVDTASGAFVVPRPPNTLAFAGVGTFSTIDGTYDSLLQTGHIFGARRCNPMAPACNDGSTCTDDACVSQTVGTCTDMSPVFACANTQNGTCSTTTSTSTTSSTTTTTLPIGHHPVIGARVVLKKSASGRETLTFVTKDPSVYVPAFGGPDDPTIVTTQIELYSTVGASSQFAIAIPPVTGKPGWTTSPTPSPTYKFKNSTAPAGLSVVRAVKLRAGRGLKIVARATGLAMTTPLGAVGIAVRFSDFGGGLPMICAHFDAASIRKDTPPVFVARTSPAPQNCDSTTLSAP